MQACHDVPDPAFQIGYPVHEQDHHIDRWQSQVVGDADVVLLQVACEAVRGVQQAHLVACLDPQLLGQWLSRVPSHDLGIMQPPPRRSNRKPRSSHNYL
jgi:hypothetical protein